MASSFDKSAEEYPDILLKIIGNLYTLNSKYIISIMQLPKYSELPEAPEEILGIIDFRGKAIPLVDMRTVFKLPTLKQEYEQFKEMLELRKQDHIVWVETLEECTKTGKEFTLATDPHKCAFGKWYDNFKSENQLINYHMRKIDEPHRKLHQTAIELTECDQNHSMCRREECLKETFRRLRENYMPKIITLLDEAKEVFKSSFTEMLIVIQKDESQIGLVVDEVVSVGTFKKLSDKPSPYNIKYSEYISNVKSSENTEELILELDGDKLLNNFTSMAS